MSRKPNNPELDDAQANAAPTAGETPADAAAPQGAPGDELTQLRAEVAALQEKNLRLVAETHNQQKRAQRERQDAVRYAEAEFARDLLVILDDLERMRAAEATSTDATSAAEGVRIVYEHFLKLLQQHGIKPIEAVGKPFDPAFHEALMQQPTTEIAPGMVMQEVAQGFQMYERVLRPARVIVSAAPPSASEV